ncbi:uncharacterized protein LOC143888724 [Tasmannia lanceolata]|uniref:uncharacterized protein LOC143888724 n=1 Tax=Tasmannia lanceolata TaxID=3420 RepID=UPI00406483B5
MDSGDGSDASIESIDSDRDYDDEDLMAMVVEGVQDAIRYYSMYFCKTPCRTSKYTGHKFIMDLLDGAPNRCYKQLRTEKHVFRNLCNLFKTRYGLTPTKAMSIEEIMAMFLMTLGHGVSNRYMQERFQHSGETISRQFHKILTCAMRFSSDMIKPEPNYNDIIPAYIQNRAKFYPYFKDCIGAIDGTHIPVIVPQTEQIPYRERKCYTSTNVMACCDFDMCFTFTWAGCEGAAHDTRIFSEALRMPDLNFSHPRGVKYYVVDAGYPNMKGYLAPYKGERSHVPAFRHGTQPISGSNEKFIQAHASLKNIIESTFRIRRNRWALLSRMPKFDLKTQIQLIVASMSLYNYIRKHASRDEEFDKADHDDTYMPIVDVGLGYDHAMDQNDTFDYAHDDAFMGRFETAFVMNYVIFKLLIVPLFKFIFGEQ